MFKTTVTSQSWLSAPFLSLNCMTKIIGNIFVKQSTVFVCLTFFYFCHIKMAVSFWGVQGQVATIICQFSVLPITKSKSIFKQYKNYLNDFDSSKFTVLTTIFQIITFRKIVDMVWYAIWEIGFFLSANPVCVPNCLSKWVQVVLNYWDEHKSQKHSKQNINT